MRQKSLLILLLVFVLAGSLYLPVTSSPVVAQEGDALQVAGLDGEVTVKYDAMGIPHIYASTPHDLFMAQGIVHAKDRWWQMEWFRHQGAGRLSELMGANLVGTDTFLRTLGLNRNAQQDWDALSEEGKAALEAYAAGVNAWIEGKAPSELASEYNFIKLLSGEIAIEPWEPLDSLLLLQALALDQESSDLSTELIRAGIVQEAGPLALAILNPPYPYDDKPVISEPGREAAAPVITPAHTAKMPQIEGTFALNLPFLQTIGGFSNSWALSGALTSTGKPFLANDPHIGIQLPAIWYQVGLHCAEVSADCAYDVFGYSAASVPGVVIGHNANIAWGLTNAGGDTMDVYTLEVNPENPLQYQYEGAWVDMEVVEETINVAMGEPVTVPVRLTRFGPVVNELVGMETPMALKWAAAAAPLGSLDGLLGLNRSANMDDFKASVAMIGAPSLNVIYADVEGNIGVLQMGRIPVRVPGDNGSLPRAGVDASTEWTGFADQTENPQLVNPEAGYIVSSNNPILRPDALPYPTYTTVYDYGYRSERIENLILASPTHDLASMAAIQTDTYNGAAPIVIPALAALDLGDPALNEAVQWLAEWDYIETVDSPYAAFFNAVWDRLMFLGLDEMIPTGSLRGDALEAYLISQMINGDHPLWANASIGAAATDRVAVLTEAVKQAWEMMTSTYGDDPNAWAWGDMHQAAFRHTPLGKLPSGVSINLDLLLTNIDHLFNRSVPFAGNNVSVNRGNWSASTGDFTLTGGISSMRMIIDFSDLDNSLFIIPMGQSGDPLSPHYDDMLTMWATGEYVDAAFTAEAVDAQAATVWTLTPG